MCEITRDPALRGKVSCTGEKSREHVEGQTAKHPAGAGSPRTTTYTNVAQWCIAALLISAQLHVMQNAWNGYDKENTFANVSTLVPMGTSIAYLLFIYFGTKIMKSRAPFEIKSLMVAYNLYQTSMNLWWCIACVRQVLHDFEGRLLQSPFAPVDFSSRGYNLGFLIWLHYNNKYVEFLDTVFMVLRKKNSQVSFLHVYHHVLILWSWFLVCKFGSGGGGYVGAFINSGIHVCMYGYYLLRLLNVPCPWKKILTRAQLSQFCICFVHSVYNMVTGVEPHIRWLSALQLFVQINMLVLFTNFYNKAYAKKHVPKDVAPKDVVPHTTGKGTGQAEKGVDKSGFTMADVHAHCTPDDCWTVVHGRVLNITDFLHKHPGGDIIHLAAGRDATILLETYHPRGVAKALLDKYAIGACSDNDSYYSWSSDFYPTMTKRVVRRLRELKLRRRGGGEMWAKSAIILLVFWGSMIGMCLAKSFPLQVLLACVMGLAASFVGTCIQHDGNHGAYASNKYINKMAGWTLDMIGASAFTWEIQHVLGHHPYTNLLDVSGPQHEATADAVKGSQESDPDVFSSFPLLRMHPSQKRSWYHKYQHLYVPFLFAFMTIGKVFGQDLSVFLDRRLYHINAACRYGNPSQPFFKTWSGIRFVAMKCLSLTYMLAFPVVCHGFLRGLGLFALGHMVCGEMLATMFIVNHVIEGVAFAARGGGKEEEDRFDGPATLEGHTLVSKGKNKRTVPNNDWAAVQCQTSVNWSSGSWFWNHFSGGLNHQIEHHLYPSICHTNYVHFQDIVESTCKEYGVPYQSESSLASAYGKMRSHLRHMGNVDSHPSWRYF